MSEDGLPACRAAPPRTVDTRSGTPVGAPTGSLNRRRRQHNLTVLADGSVLATGGQSTNGGGGLVDLANAVYEAERWDPATGRGPSSRRPRSRASTTRPRCCCPTAAC